MTEQNEFESAPLLLCATDTDVGKRLDQFAAEATELTRSAVTRLIEDGDLTCNGQRTSKNYRLRKGDCIELRLPEPEPCEAIPQDIPLDIV